MADAETLTLISGGAEPKEFKISKAAAQLIQQIEHLRAITQDATEIPVDTIQAYDLAPIVEYCEYHGKVNNDSKAATEADIMKFDEAFITRVTKSDRQHIRLIAAADSLVIPSLLQLLMRAMVAKLHNKDRAAIREQWGIAADLTEDEEKEVMESTSWLRPPQ